MTTDSWTTQDELRFIDELGYSNYLTRQDESVRYLRTAQLKQYVVAASRRIRWGEIDGRLALAYAQATLASEN